MAEQLQFELVSPERQLMSEAVHMVVVPGMEGDFGVLVNHAPFMSTIRPGMLQVYQTAGGQPERIFVFGGFAEVNGEGLTVLAERAMAEGDIDRAEIAQQLKDAQEDAADAKDDDARDRAQKLASDLQAVLDAL